MSIRRLFLDWTRPSLAVAVDYLVERFGAAGALDLGGVIVALPGGRSSRRLLELLVERAEAGGRTLVPPRLVTVGKLPEMLYTAKRPFAGDLVQQLAWVEALRNAKPERVAALLPSLPETDDLETWLALGEMLGRLHRELAAEAMDFQSVVDCGGRIEGFREQPRWQALLDIQAGYLRTLDGLGLWDLQTARLFAIRHGECQTEDQIVLVGTADMNRAGRMMLDQVADRVTALVFAPERLADRFDEHGCLVPGAWQDAEIELATDRIEVVDGPADQAAAVVRAMAAWDGRYAGDEITVGVPDVRLVPYIAQQLRQCDVPVRYGVGRPMTESGPCRLLEAVADYLDGKRFSSFAALARHPDVQRWLEARPIRSDWLTEMDQYYVDHLPHRLGGRWLGKPEGSAALRRVHEAIEGLLSGLDAPRRPLAEWNPPLVELLVTLFGGSPLDPTVPAQRTTLKACEKIHKTLAEHQAIPAELTPTVSGGEAIQLVLRAIVGERIAPLPDRSAVELLGWLELPLDDAPALVVTGMNEGIVPASLNADLFLPNQLRRELGIEDNDRRYARDAYALAAVVASRADVTLVAGRRSPDGDPLAPSRLLFAADAETAARRAVRFFHREDATAARLVLPGVLRAGRTESRLGVPRPEPLAEPVASMRVTEFRDYLVCPYRYYLKHRLGLAGLKDEAEELDGGAFGSMAHEVLGDFGRSPVAASTDPEAIAAFLDAALEHLLGQFYGPAPLSAILVQVEQLRARLRRFAQWQADWAAQGWRIEHVETGPEPEQASLVVDGSPMFLRGRIDRIDVHESTGQRMIFDYKTSDTLKTPRQAHCAGGEWIDLQLPLYRHLVAGMGIKGPVDMGYIVLPKDTSRVGLQRADWTEDELREADAAAETVVRGVRAEVFWPPADPPPAFSEEFAAICQDGRLGSVLDDKDDNGDAE
ncbi:MAG: PD-(D/E)XK nuclease family protein [Planctomycetia bacterium]|nr:PD-(D/E)XK nuclease family protein [Planctomycetia bacterium]